MASHRPTPFDRGRAAMTLATLVAGLLVSGQAFAQCAIVHTQKLGAPDPSTNRSFGGEIAIDGDVALVGSQFDDYLCPGVHDCDAGSAQVFTRVGGVWMSAQRLTSSQAEVSEYFSCSIALGGGRALIGAYGHDTVAGTNTGFVYDFRLEGGQWVEHGILEASDATAEAWFGWRVAMEGSIAAVAAQGANESDAVYVFRYINGEWEEEQKLTPDIVGNANFGHSLAIEGGRIIVGANGEDGMGAAYLYRYDGLSWVLDQRLAPPAGSPGDRFGESVAIFGSYCLVAATGENGGADDSGAIHVYWNSGAGWQHSDRLVPSDPLLEAAFGSTIAFVEGLAVIGALIHDGAGESAGQAYAFAFDGGVWTEAALLRPAEVDEIDKFGAAAAIEGTEVMIGASGDDDPCGGGICGAGAVYVFRPLANCNANASLDECEIRAEHVPDCNVNGVPDACDIASGESADCDANGIPDGCDLAAGGDCNDNGIPDACDIAQSTSADCNGNGLPDECDPFAPPGGEQKRVAPAPVANDADGWSVAVFGDFAVTGVPFRDAQGNDSGAAYVLRRVNGAWANEATLVPVDLTSFDFFGGAVAAERDLVLVGARSAPTGNNTSAGAVYAFRREGGLWVETAKIVPPIPVTGIHFGHAVAVCGDLLIVGAPRENAQRGAAYLYRFDGAAWVFEAKLLPPVAAAADEFGCSVAIDGDVAVVGERFDDDVLNNAGAAHVYRFDGQGWVHEAKLTNPAGAASDFLGTSVSVSGDRLAVGALRGTVSGIAQGTVHVYIHGGPGWTLQSILTTGTGQALSWFGCSTSIVGKTVLVGAYNADVGPIRSGAAYLFQHDGAQWTPRGQFAPSVVAQSDQVGFAVAFDGQSLSLGAPFDDEGANAAGASYFFEVPVGPALVTRQPASLRVAAGTRASFTVAAVGNGSLSYQWQKDQLDLADGDGISGATTPRLVIDPAGQDDEGLYRCVVTSGCGTADSREANLFVTMPLGVAGPTPGPRLEFVGSHPNPFRGSTRIVFHAPARGRVKIEIYGLRGEQVARLLDGEAAPGSNDVRWEGTDSNGSAVPSGVYLCRITGFGETRTRRLTLVR